MAKYADFRNDLSTHPVTGDLLLFTDEAAIKNQIKNLVMIDFYEIAWKPEIGAGVPQTLFDNFGADTEYQIKIRIEETITKYVKRAELIDVRVIYDNHNGYEVTIIFRPLNRVDNETLKMILARTR